MLKSMPQLEIIALDRNLISYTDSSIPDDTFAGLSHLKSISIWFNAYGFNISVDDYAFILQKASTHAGGVERSYSRWWKYLTTAQ